MGIQGRFCGLRWLPACVLLFATLLFASPALGAASGSCSTSYFLPGDIGDFGSDPPDQEDLDIYSWQLFLALNAPAVGSSVSTTGDNSTLWGGSVAAPISSSNPGWSSTDDLLQQVTLSSVPQYGSHYYPPECQAIAGYQGYRVVDELSKVDDGFFEATVKNLSGSPVAATNGTFLRYEILISPVTYGAVVKNQWYLSSVLAKLSSPLNFPCGVSSSGGPKASPADLGIGAITIKNAWMDAAGIADKGDYHLENLLVFTSGTENSNGQNSCLLKTMALVGMHIAHKTTEQSAWTWSTFEHNANAPDCTTVPAPPPHPPASQNTNCPPNISATAFNLAPSTGSISSRFQTCNATPATNQGTNTCDDGFCADLAPNPTAGYSNLCRQVPLAKYASALAQSQACSQALGAKSVWSNYSLISTQWFTNFGSQPTCVNAAPAVNPQTAGVLGNYAPQVLMSDNQTTFPYLANTSMESYERSVCMGCHQQATAGGSGVSTDLMYFIQLEVPAAPVNQPPSLQTKTSRSRKN